MLYFRDEIVSWIWYLASKIHIYNSRWLYLTLLPLLLKFMHYALCIVTCNDLSVNVEMKSRVKVFHALGLVVGSGVKFGDNVTLRARVTIGERSRNDLTAPIIGNNVEFGVGAMVFGDIRIPDDTFIKANDILS